MVMVDSLVEKPVSLQVGNKLHDLFICRKIVHVKKHVQVSLKHGEVNFEDLHQYRLQRSAI